MKKLLLFLLIVVPFLAIGQKTDATMETAAISIRDKTAINSISPAMVGNLFLDIIRNKMNAIYTFDAIGTNSYVMGAGATITTYVKGQTYIIYPEHTNTSTTVTLNVNGAGVKSLKTNLGGAITVGNLMAGSPYMIQYNGTEFRLLGGSSSGGSGGAVTSFNGRTGDIAPTTGDYDISQITNGLTNVLSSGRIIVGNGSNLASPVVMSGDATINNTGAVSVNKIAGNTIPSNATGYLFNNGSGTLSWAAAGSGTVTSVAISAPSIFSTSGTPITTSGTLGLSLVSQSSNTFFAGPNGSSGTPTFRSIVAADIPALPYWKTTGTTTLTGNIGIDGSASNYSISFGSPTNSLNNLSVDALSNISLIASNTSIHSSFDAYSSTSGVEIHMDTGIKLNTGTDATGDTYYRNSSGYLNPVTIGSSGQFYKVVSGAPTWATLASADIPNNGANTTGSAAKWTTARNLAGNSVDGSANVAFSNKFIVQGTTDAGLSGAQFLGALSTGILKNTTSTGVLSIAVAADFPPLNQNTTGTAANLSGTPALPNGTTATTQSNGDNSLKLANTAYVANAITAAALPAADATHDGYLTQTDWVNFNSKVGASSIIDLAHGGTNAALSGSNGGIFYSTSSAGAILSGTATANKMLLSGSSAAPTWSTSTIPTSAGATANKILLSDGTNYVLSTPTFPNASATSGKIIKSDGTNWIASTETYASPGTSGNLLISDGTNWTSAAPTFWNLGGTSTLSSANTIVGTSSNTFKIQFNGLTASPVEGAGIHLQNSTAAVNGTQQDGPSIVIEGQGFNTTGSTTGANKWRFLNRPVQGTNQSSSLLFQNSTNGGAYSTLFTLTGSGVSSGVYSFTNNGSLQGITGGISYISPNAAATAHTFTGTYSGSANGIGFSLGMGFNPTVNTFTYKDVAWTGTFNQTGAATGDVWFAAVEPIITSIQGTVHAIDYNPSITTLSGTHNGLTIRPTGAVNGFGTGSPNSTLQVNGSLATGYVAKTANYTLSSTDNIVECTSGSFTITLPTAVGITGRWYLVDNSGAGTITIATTSSQTIDGAAPGTLTGGQKLWVYSNGANYRTGKP